jgi:hypothetical protein
MAAAATPAAGSAVAARATPPTPPIDGLDDQVLRCWLTHEDIRPAHDRDAAALLIRTPAAVAATAADATPSPAGPECTTHRPIMQCWLPAARLHLAVRQLPDSVGLGAHLWASSKALSAWLVGSRRHWCPDCPAVVEGRGGGGMAGVEGRGREGSSGEQLLAFVGARVVELGAGLGLPGLVAAGLGAQHVLLSDCSPTLVANLAVSARESSRSSAAVASVEADVLDWNVFTQAYADGSAQQRALRDDYDERFRGQFDVVLAADVVYNPSHAVSFCEAACALLATGLSTLLLVQPGTTDPGTGRFDTRNGWAELLELLAQRGSLSVSTFYLFDDSADSGRAEVQLVEFRKTVLCICN